MSESREANVAKVLMYILIPVGAVVAIYYIVKQLLARARGVGRAAGERVEYHVRPRR